MSEEKDRRNRSNKLSGLGVPMRHRRRRAAVVVAPTTALREDGYLVENMPKRQREQDEDDANPRKSQFRYSPRLPLSPISKVSDEILLDIFRNLTIQDIVCCQTVSHRWQSISRDPELWKHLYFLRFIKPRLSNVRSRSRIKAAREWWRLETTQNGESKKDWKKLFKVRFNWHFGRCAISEMDIDTLSQVSMESSLIRKEKEKVDCTYIPPLVQFDGKMFITADEKTGLRAWHIGSVENGERRLIGRRPFERYERGWYMGSPTALAIDVSGGEPTDIAIGFDGGGVLILRLNSRNGREEIASGFEITYVVPPSLGNPVRITHLAYSHPYLLTLDETHTLRAYLFQSESDVPRLLTTLHAQGLNGPCNLTLRREKGFSDGTIIASIAYSISLFHRGWSVGIQEVILDTSTPDGVAQTRVGTCFPSTYQLPITPDQSPSYLNPSSIPVAFPTSISYSHPYLLTSHLDNTLTLYVVRSRKDSISISQPQRLWGHTAAVARAGIGDRGRAVSVSDMGPEVRVWELESLAVAASKSDGERTVEFVQSVRVENVSPILKMMPRTATTVEWIGFDEEKVLVVTGDRAQDNNVMLYDFTV
jgi:hypothetical protein